MGIYRPGTASMADPAPPTRARRGGCALAVARRQFLDRSDNQIAGLEMLASALAISTWEEEFWGRNVRIFSDNTIAEWSFRRGSAKCCDHAAIVHHFWSVIGQLKIRLLIDRVPSGGCARRSGRQIAQSPRRVRRQYI